MKRKYTILVQGQNHEWGFGIEAEPSHVEDWRRDGLIIHEVLHTIPEWVVDLGLERPWCFLQDVFYFRNPFKS